jgi:Protein of unknown function (DUF3237)
MTALAAPLEALPGIDHSIELVPLFRGTWRLAPYLIMPDTPAGTRVIIDIPEGGFEGRGIKARTRTGSADWFIIGPDGTGTLDWRGTVTTEDGAAIYMYGSGRRDVSQSGSALIRGTCQFDTSDQRYRWLNKLAAAYRAISVGEGTDENIYHDEYFEIR